MDKRVYLFTLIAFIVGMVELIIGGILDLIADDLHIGLGRAGLLITIFSFVFAIMGPILLFVTAKVERTRLMIISLFIFLLGNLVAIFSSTYLTLVLSRIITAASSSLLVVLSITLASNIVAEQYRGRAIGIVVMGISGSIVLGVPSGVMLGHSFDWRAPFFVIATLTVFLMVTVYFLMGKITSPPVVSLRKQLATLKNHKVLFAQLTTFFFLAGHFTLYGFLTPFANSLLGLNGVWITLVYLLFGIAAVTGGGIGGLSSDSFGPKPTIVSVTLLLAVTLLTITTTTQVLPLFFSVLVVWGILSWAITPPVQSYLMHISPKTASIQQSLNNSSLHFGIAFGTFIGSFVIDRYSVELNATVGALFVFLSLVTGLIAMRGERNERTSFQLNRSESS